MQKILTILIILTFSHNVFALDAAVENIQSLCGLAKEGKQSEIKGKIQMQADGSVKLATVGGKGELSFSKGEWSGLQQILWAKQPDSAKTYADCVKNTLPYFKSKAVTPTPKPAAKTSSKSAKSGTSSKPAATPTPKPAAPTEPGVEQSTETTGDITGNQNVTGNNAGGDMNINFGSNPK